MPPPPTRVPDPLQGLPASLAPLAEAERVAARQAVAAAERGDLALARRTAARLPQRHPVARFVELEIRFLEAAAIYPDCLQLAEEFPEWVAPWHLAAMAARRSGDLLAALGAARRAVAAEAGSHRLQGLVQELEAGVVERARSEAERWLGAGEAAKALGVAEQALEAVPESPELRTLAAEAALAAGRTDRAAALLPAVPDSANGLALKGRVAGALGQWDLAVSFFEKLPAAYPGRCDLLRRARLELRLADAPPYVSKALASSALTRAELAALLVWEVPEITALAQGAVPVFEDIVDLPQRGDIVTVARAGVLRGDPVARRFGARRGVTPREVAAAVERVAVLLRRQPPQFCNHGAAGDAAGCVRLGTPVTGREVAEVLQRLGGPGGEGCP